MNYNLLDNAPEYATETAGLLRWSENYSFPTPANLFLDLIGYSVEEYGANTCESVPSDKFGYLECDHLGAALVEYAFVESVLAPQDEDQDEE